MNKCSWCLGTGKNVTGFLIYGGLHDCQHCKPKQPIRTIVPHGCMLADTFTHSVVNFMDGKRVLVGQKSVCEDLAATNHRYIVGVLRAPLREALQ
jgi:hypothetical protein